MRVTNNCRVVALSVLLTGLAGCTAARPAKRSYKIYPDSLKQTIDFEIDSLPGQVFKLVIPEIITDQQEILVPWSQEVPYWDIGPNHASWHCETAGLVRQTSTVLFGDEVIEAQVEITNLSDRTWRQVNAFTCFAFYAAPLFDNPELDRMMFPVNGRWRSVADLFAEKSPGNGPYTFFAVQGGPPLRDMMVVRLVKQTHPQIIDYGAGCVVSKDGRWVAGISSSHPAYVFCNRKERCLHANPVYDEIAPGQTACASSYVRIMRGGVADFAKAAGVPVSAVSTSAPGR
jgi:hypothetical protein